MKLKHNFYSQTIINTLIKKGVAPEEIYRGLNIPANVKAPLDFELTIEGIHFLTLLFKQRILVSNCGLEVAKLINYHKTDFFGSYAHSCQTLGEAVSKIHAVHKEINPLIEYEISLKKASQFIYHIDKIWEIKYPESAKEITDFAMANGLFSARALTKQNITPLSVEFKYDKPECFGIYEQVFQCPVFFNQNVNRIKYPVSIMAYKIPTYNPFLLTILNEFAQKMIQDNKLESDIVAKVKSIIVKTERFKMPKEDDIASELGMSKRTLQKQLYDKQKSFQRIKESVYIELAYAYLESDDISIKEIAWSLGYNDVGNFYRAFKRWTGLTPKQYKLSNKNK